MKRILVFVLATATFVFAASAIRAQTLNYSWSSIAPETYAHYGRIEDFAKTNHGDISNAGLIIGSKCIAVIDTGGSPVVGRAQRQSIARLTNKPICYVINTHVHPDHIMGNVAYADIPGVRFVGNVKLAAAMNSRGRIYLNAMLRELGEDAIGAEIVLPTLKVDSTVELDLGDRKLTLKPWPTAHTDHDLTVFDHKTKTLWTGDLLFVSHAPVVDGSVKGWLKVLENLQTDRPNHLVPGHGKSNLSWPKEIALQTKYLQELETQIRDAIKRGLSLAQTLNENQTIPKTLHEQWELLENFHRRNLTAVYAELEWE